MEIFGFAVFFSILFAIQTVIFQIHILCDENKIPIFTQ